MEQKNTATAFLLALLPMFFAGGLAFHDFYLKRIGIGISKLAMQFIGWVLFITSGVFFATEDDLMVLMGGGIMFIAFAIFFATFIWNVVDMFLIPKIVDGLNKEQEQLVAGE